MNGTYIDTPIDERDYPISMAFDEDEDIVLPDRFETSFQPPFAKQVANNCVAQTLANIMEVMYYKYTEVHRDFSVGFIYGNRYEGQGKGEGMSGYTACSNLCKDGDIFAEMFENPGTAPSIIDAVAKFKEEHPEWKDKAYIPKMYIRTTDEEKAKAFIYKYDIPVMAIAKLSEFSIGDDLHAMALYGWEGKTAIMQNSWGEDDPQKIVRMPLKKIKDFWLILPFDICNFIDLSRKHFAFNDIVKCNEKGIVKGYVDNTFKPDREITRAEFAVMIHRYLKGGG